MKNKIITQFNKLIFMKRCILQLFKSLFRLKLFRSEYKYYRTDLSKWEEAILVLNFIKIYKYSIWINGQSVTNYKFKGLPNPKYIKSATHTDLKFFVGRKEYEDNYQSNKWLIPINKQLNLEIE